MMHIADMDLHDHRIKIVEDVKNLIKKYHSLFEKSAFDIDADLADALILREMRSALKNIQDDRLDKIINWFIDMVNRRGFNRHI